MLVTSIDGGNIGVLDLRLIEILLANIDYNMGIYD